MIAVSLAESSYEDRDGPDPCTARNETPEACPNMALFAVQIGDRHSRICLDHAKSLFNALGFMIMSETGVSLQALVGLRSGKRTMPGRQTPTKVPGAGKRSPR